MGLSTRLRNDLYCVEWDVKLYYTIPYLQFGMVIQLSNTEAVTEWVFILCQLWS